MGRGLRNFIEPICGLLMLIFSLAAGVGTLGTVRSDSGGQVGTVVTGRGCNGASQRN